MKILDKLCHTLNSFALLFSLLLPVCPLLTGCSGTETTDSPATEVSAGQTGDTTGNSDLETALGIALSDMFTDRDMEIGYDDATCGHITLKGSTASSDTDAVTIAEGTVTISEEGTYLVSGTLENGMLLIDAGDNDKIHLILDNASISNDTSATIYVRSADKVFLTLAPDSSNTLRNGGSYEAIDDNNIDSVIFSKDDLTLNGNGSLTIQAVAGHGIVSKDDLVITGGSYDITAEKHALAGKDSIRIADGSFTITCGTDGLHGSNDDDAALGFLYIAGGSFSIAAGDDGMHSDYILAITDGAVDITESYEGLEGSSIYITGGEISLIASDDGMNAASGSSDETAGGTTGMDGAGNKAMNGGMMENDPDCNIYISGGTLTIDAGGDGIDSNGSLYISDGIITVSGAANGGDGALDYAGSASITGGTLLATGFSQMAQNLGETSTQGCMLVTVDEQAAGTTVTLMDNSGTALSSWEAAKAYNSVLISVPALTQGETYALTAGTYSTEITLDSLIYGDGSMGVMGMPGGEGMNRPDGGTPMEDLEIPEGKHPSGDEDFQPGDAPAGNEDFQPGDPPAGDENFRQGEPPAKDGDISEVHPSADDQIQ